MLIPIHGIPLIRPGDDLVKIILGRLRAGHLSLTSGDILVLTQKIVSKAEGAIADLDSSLPSAKALKLARSCDKDARLVELILQQSAKVLRQRAGVLITKHRRGWVCANAGIDFSNMPGNYVSLLPKDPDRTARDIRKRIRRLISADVAVLIIDSHGRAFRKGAIGVAVGCAGITALKDMRGRRDLFHYRLRSTEIALADELASAASLLMGQANEGIPAVVIRGLKYRKNSQPAKDLIRPEAEDLFC